ncbi:MAG: phosphate/phosphite/phosphonate ABC transporter substrate-binding protein [Thiobacillaceae bacterium]|jgi:phosphonate transport system substrate-binding protein|nr:phosphate/phosphite/phosphonate ABC transporter substrate-binding protein [Thiobacillaceae bacterium]
MDGFSARRGWLRQAVALLLCCLAQTATAAETRVYTVGVVPMLTGLAMHRDWSPLLERLGTVTGRRFRLAQQDSIADFERAFLRGEPDFAFMNPYHAVMARHAQGYRPLVRDGAEPLTGILVVRKDSAYRGVRDLDGATIAFPSPNAFAASLYMRALLTERERIGFNPHYAESHGNAYRQVLLGKAAAAGSVSMILERERPEVRNALRVVYTTPSGPSHPLVVHPRVPDAVADAVRQALLDLARDPEGARLLAGALLPRPVAADYRRDYQPLEALRLERYAARRDPGP